MTYEPLCERFEVLRPDGSGVAVELCAQVFGRRGKRPDFLLSGAGCGLSLLPRRQAGSPPKDGEETVVGISGLSLAPRVRVVLACLAGKRAARLTREQKIHVAGRRLERQIEARLTGGQACLPFDSWSLYIHDELANLAGKLNLVKRGSDATL